MEVGQPSLDQLRVFLAVAEEGSFNRAAKRLGRAISVVSYAVTNLESQLGLSLFAREGSRSPVLTEAGRALLGEARMVAGDVDALLARARSLHAGLEPELSLTVDVMIPGEVLAAVLRGFQATFPSVALRLAVDALGAVAARVLDGSADIGIGGPVIAEHVGLERQAIGAVELVPVAAPDHPLALMASVPPGEARRHLQLVLSDRSVLTEGREFSVLASRNWRLADLGAKHVLLREGLGWGNMPLPMIADDLAVGMLVRLVLPENPQTSYPLSALWRRDIRPGPAAQWAIAEFEAKLRACPGTAAEI